MVGVPFPFIHSTYGIIERMEFTTYRELSARTELNEEQYRQSIKVIADDPIEIRRIHLGLGIFSEAGEVADVLKRHLFYGKEFNRTDLIEELGDVLWYFTQIMTSEDISLEEVMVANINKLKVRYPETFSQESALNRNIEAERKALEA